MFGEEDTFVATKDLEYATTKHQMKDLHKGKEQCGALRKKRLIDCPLSLSPGSLTLRR